MIGQGRNKRLRAESAKSLDQKINDDDESESPVWTS